MASMISEALFDAISKIAVSEIQKAQPDMTIDGEIVKIMDVEEGGYQVKYEGNLLNAYSSDKEVTYRKGERVYILVPQGDFSRKKIIVGKSGYTNKQDTLQKTKDFYIEKSENLVSESMYDCDDTLEICACPEDKKSELEFPANYAYYTFIRKADKEWTEADKVQYYLPIDNNILLSRDAIFQSYADSTSHLKIQAKFQTTFKKDYKVGAYALEVVCIQINPKYGTDPKEEQYNLVKFSLDSPSFEGRSPYYQSGERDQIAYFEIPETGLLGIWSIGLVQNGELQMDEAAGADVNNRNNIICRDLQISFVDKLDATNTLYYPWIETPYGASLMSSPNNGGRTEIILIPHLQYSDNDLIGEENCFVRWFIQDATVTESSVDKTIVDEHNKASIDYSGPGWRPIEELMEETPKGQEDKNNYKIGDNYSLTIKSAAVPTKWKYKAVIVYYQQDSKTNFYNEINKSEIIKEVTKLDSPYNLYLEQSSNDGYTLEVRDKNDPLAVWYADWYLKRLEESYILLEEKHQGKIDISKYLLAKTAVFYAQCYDPKDVVINGEDMRVGAPITVLEKQVVLSTGSDILILWTGQSDFNYDALGGTENDIDSGKEYVLVPKIVFEDGKGINYGINIYSPDGATILARGAQPYNTDTSMMKDIYIDKDNGIHFKIRETYDPQQTANTFKIEIMLANGKIIEDQKEVYFSKDGDQGTIGTEWKAQIRPCIWKSNDRTAQFKDAVDGLCPIIVEPNGNNINLLSGDFTQYGDNENRLFLRPFVTRKGKPIEELDPFEGYYFRAYWDVRFPNGSTSAESRVGTAYSSFLRLYHTSNYDPDQREEPITGLPFDVSNGGAWETGGPKSGNLNNDIKVNPGETEESARGLVGYTCYPVGAESAGKSVYENDLYETYGAVEVKYQSNNNRQAQYSIGLNDINFRFIVKCQVDIMRGVYDQGTGHLIPEGHTERVASITTYYPIDIIFLQQNTDNHNYNDIFEKLKTLSINWPRYVQYDARGNTPYQMEEKLGFIFAEGDNKDVESINKAWAANRTAMASYLASVDWDKYDSSVEYKEAVDSAQKAFKQKENELSGLLNDSNFKPYNWTPHTQTIEEQKEYRTENGQAIVDHMSYFYRANPHLDMANGFHGALTTNPNTPIKFANNISGIYLRDQVMMLNLYGNVDINGWDGQGLDTNEKDGTIFGATFGAGYKRPSTNAFTGVLMGVDKSQKRSDMDGWRAGVDKEQDTYMPYLTGVFGYQEGVQSFGLLENGTAFFGRADGGGRILLDGINGTIYGGANGQMGSPKIGDAMWNSMRISLVDLTHATEDYNSSSSDWEYTDIGTSNEDLKKKTIHIAMKNGDKDPIKLGYAGSFYKLEDNSFISSDSLPQWYKTVWTNAYVKKDKALPWWLTDTSYEDLNEWNGEFSGENNYKVDYFSDVWVNDEDGKYYRIADEETQEIIKENRDKRITFALSSFGPSRASTTPAIEIGQHPHGLMPGLIPYDDFEDVFKNLTIPGDRNFMVTYDGTLWAMNGVFMGAVIGSNIVGGRIQGAEIGIGDKIGSGEKTYLITDSECHWTELIPPKEEKRPVVTMAPFTKVKRKFVVDRKGNLGAYSANITGGSIDIGTFHVIGENQGKVGHLIQSGESDFIGDTHFFGNVGIAPVATKDGPFYYYEDNGSITQTGGVVALGVPYSPTSEDNEEAKAEALKAHNIVTKYIKTKRDSSTLFTYRAKDTYKTQQEMINALGKGNSLQSNAIFAIEARGDAFKENGKGILGHFWPLAFVCKKDFEGFKPYVTIMDQFKNSDTNSEIFALKNDGANFFRLSHWGAQIQDMFVRGDFQSENMNEEPDVRGQWYGYFGRVSSGIEGLTEAAANKAIGITSWNQVPIIFKSDNNVEVKSRKNFIVGAGHIVEQNLNGTCTEGLANDSDPYLFNGDQLSNLQTQLIMWGADKDNLDGTYATESRISMSTQSGAIGIFIDEEAESMNHSGYLDSSCIASSAGLCLEGISTIDRNPITGDMISDSHLYGYSKTRLFGSSKGEKGQGLHLYCKNSYLDNIYCENRGAAFTELFLGEYQATLFAKNNIVLAVGGSDRTISAHNTDNARGKLVLTNDGHLDFYSLGTMHRLI